MNLCRKHCESVHSKEVPVKKISRFDSIFEEKMLFETKKVYTNSRETSSTRENMDPVRSLPGKTWCRLIGTGKHLSHVRLVPSRICGPRGHRQSETKSPFHFSQLPLTGSALSQMPALGAGLSKRSNNLTPIISH